MTTLVFTDLEEGCSFSPLLRYSLRGRSLLRLRAGSWPGLSFRLGFYNLWSCCCRLCLCCLSLACIFSCNETGIVSSHGNGI